jgi:hypothetical protein
MQRPPTADGMRGGYDQRGGGPGRGYPNGGPVGRGGRPGPPERSATSDPGSKYATAIAISVLMLHSETATFEKAAENSALVSRCREC